MESYSSFYIYYGMVKINVKDVNLLYYTVDVHVHVESTLT
jgi:hypothetical protein